MKKIMIILLILLSAPINLFSQLSIVKIKFNEGYYSSPANNGKLSFTSLINNQDSIQHTNIQLYIKNLQNNQIFTSPIKSLISVGDSALIKVDSVSAYYPPYVQTNQSFIFWVKYDQNTIVYYTDTLKLWNSNNAYSSLAVDNNIYTEKNFTKISDTSSYNYGGIIANKFIFKDFSGKCPIGMALALGARTTIGAIIKGALFKKNGNDFIIIAESDYFTIQSSDINTDSTNSPNLTNLIFLNNDQCFYKDSIYLAAISYYGGSDTVFVAQDNSALYQEDSTVWFFNNNTNSWLTFSNIKSTPIVRLLFNYGNCSYGGIVNLSSNAILLNGNSGSMQYIGLTNNCNNISNIICKPWLTCYIIGNNIVVKSLSANLTGSPRYDTILVYDNYGGSTYFNVTQLANVSVTEYDDLFFAIYPNPTNDKIFVQLPANVKVNSFSIYSAIGEEIKRTNCIKTDDKEIVMDVSSLSKGMYFVKIKTDKNAIIKKFIKE
jgi:hypothetical protein